MKRERIWILNEDPDYEICYVTPLIGVLKLKRASCAYRVAKVSGNAWIFVNPEIGRFPINGIIGDPEFDGSIYYANDAFRFANQIRRNGAPS